MGPSARRATSRSTLRAGEVRALAGENGAGKSTHRQACSPASRAPTRARCSSTASPSTSTARADARDAGIAVIYQEPTLFPDLSVAENV